MLKQKQNVRQTASKIKIVYDLRHRGAATSQQHSFIASSCGVVIRDNCPFQWESWAEIPEDTKELVRHELSKKSVAGQKARESKILLHHSGSKPFSYRLEERRQEGSKFPEIDMFKDVYVRPGNETAEQFYDTMVEKSTAVLQEAAS
ncbi:uncharacterized protein LOC103959299 isoform X1 [Pyrus x bretschneideri]|uniref:uncharacterized protein LOC103959299 isoform X1 n=1 Tax=Pyrus x bretschneideri TaxID=225117 RepID=UPI00202DDB99|nr:uncharacterized protein LOC103959299 isoform X1 [Pyrus x bretschneideri]